MKWALLLVDLQNDYLVSPGLQPLPRKSRFKNHCFAARLSIKEDSYCSCLDDSISRDIRSTPAALEEIKSLDLRGRDRRP